MRSDRMEYRTRYGDRMRAAAVISMLTRDLRTTPESDAGLSAKIVLVRRELEIAVSPDAFLSSLAATPEAGPTAWFVPPAVCVTMAELAEFLVANFRPGASRRLALDLVLYEMAPRPVAVTRAAVTGEKG